MSENTSFANRAEEEAVSFLKKMGYRILARNYKKRWGEVDIVAEDKGVLVFVEVKARRTLKLGLPFEAVDKRKQTHIQKTALAFLQEHPSLGKRKMRFDVVSLCWERGRPLIDLFTNAFEV